MSKGKYQNGKPKMSMKPLALLLAAVLLVGATIGGTLAWLQATTEKVTNTFTDSNIGVTLEETTTEYKMIPGHYIEKDPVVTVLAGSEDSWVFLEVTESANLNDYIIYEIDPNNWTPLVDDGNDGKADNGVYYCKAKDITADRKIKVLGYTDSNGVYQNNKVLVEDNVTKEMMNAIKDGTADEPTLTFRAYAVQLMKNNDEEFTAAEAWVHAQTLKTESPAPSESEGANP